MLRGLFHLNDESLHVVGFLLGDADVNDISRDSGLDEDDGSVVMCERLAFGGDRFDGDVLKDEIEFLSCHIYLQILSNMQIYQSRA